MKKWTYVDIEVLDIEDTQYGRVEHAHEANSNGNNGRDKEKNNGNNGNGNIPEGQYNNGVGGGSGTPGDDIYNDASA